ncbi:MAG TPA: transporter substrate-binding domain-containing protein [Nitrospiraceae bacterium]
MNRKDSGADRVSAAPRWVLLCVALAGLSLQGCGLVHDALQYVAPVAADELDAICRRQRVQVGMAVEPFRPFVFPAIWTDEGSRVTGLDVELVRHIVEALSQLCGRPITPVLHLVRFRDLFLQLSEGKLDMFVSAVPSNVPIRAWAGFAYSIPYFQHGGLSGITRRPDVADRIRQRLQPQSGAPSSVQTSEEVLAGLAVAVQKGTASQHYAVANLPASRVVLCDSLPAAFESAESSADPGIDVILGAVPVLEYMVARVKKEWRLLVHAEGKPFFLTRGQYAVVMSEESYRLRWFVNGVIFRLDESGQLERMRARWMDEPYAFPRRAAVEGLPFDVEKMVLQYSQGACRADRAR